MFYVYRFVDINKTILYIGKTNNLQTRMYQHKTSKMPFWKEFYKIEFLEFENEGDQLLCEILLINKYKPKYNTKDKFNSTIQFDVLKEEWKVYDEIRRYSNDEIAMLCLKYEEMNGVEKGAFIRSLKDKVKYARDEEERSIRKDNLNRFSNMCELKLGNMDIDDGLNMTNTYHNGFGVFEVNESNPKAQRTLYIRNADNKFQISGCGTITMTKEQLKSFLIAIAEKYDLQLI